MKIGVCVPCHSDYIQYLDRLLLSIENQTLKPHIVSISISGLTDVIAIPTFVTTFPIKITTTKLLKNAGENRNIAVDQIKDDVDIISFFDADDFMHPQRLEIIHNAFTKYDIDAFLHDCMKCQKIIPTADLITTINSIQITKRVFNKFIYSCNNRFIDAIDDNNKYVPVVAGHISVKSSIFNTHRVPERSVGYEDSEFSKNLFTFGYKMSFTPDMLSLYCCVGVIEKWRLHMHKHNHIRSR